MFAAKAAPTIRGFDEFLVGASLLANLHGPVLLACPRCSRSRRFETAECGVPCPGFTTDFGNHRRGWSRLEPAAKGVELVVRPAHQYFDAAIEQIGCPPGQSEGKCSFARRAAEEYALYAAGNEAPPARHRTKNSCFTIWKQANKTRDPASPRFDSGKAGARHAPRRKRILAKARPLA